MMALLEIVDLHANAGDAEILRGVSLTVDAGEVHAIMGPNGSGKSTLAQVLAGHPAYRVTRGTVTFAGHDLLDMEPEERAHAGLFLAFQYPVEIPGVTNAYFLRTAYNAIRKARGLDELDPMDFLDLLEDRLRVVEWGPEIMERAVNAGFSGGEKKRNEILQMAVLEPTLAVLDETDSGLDIDALRIVAKGVNALRRPDRATVLVTHYQRLLNYIVPDRVHVLSGGRIVKSGGKELAHELEERGYEWLTGTGDAESVTAPAASYAATASPVPAAP
jgi:Fe-S cluster assembly ATP-binding protein